jgi:hypothetical protein
LIDKRKYRKPFCAGNVFGKKPGNSGVIGDKMQNRQRQWGIKISFLTTSDPHSSTKTDAS